MVFSPGDFEEDVTVVLKKKFEKTLSCIVLSVAKKSGNFGLKSAFCLWHCNWSLGGGLAMSFP